MEKIGTIVRRHRLAKGLTQEELGSKVFVSKQAVSKWETGKTLPDIETVRRLCDILEIDKDEILGGSIKETKKSRKLSIIFAVISVISIFCALFFGFGGLDFIDRRTQSGFAYVSVFWNGELLPTDQYNITSALNFEDYKNGYKADIDYGEIRADILFSDKYHIEIGFFNTNNWHNIHIRLDADEQDGQLIVKQTISYETDDNLYQVTVNENTASGYELSVFQEGV